MDKDLGCTGAKCTDNQPHTLLWLRYEQSANSIFLCALITVHYHSNVWTPSHLMFFHLLSWKLFLMELCSKQKSANQLKTRFIF